MPKLAALPAGNPGSSRIGSPNHPALSGTNCVLECSPLFSSSPVTYHLPLIAHLFPPLNCLGPNLTLPENNTMLGLPNCPPGLADHSGSHLPTGRAHTRIWQHHFPSRTLVIQHLSFSAVSLTNLSQQVGSPGSCLSSTQSCVPTHKTHKTRVTLNLVCLLFPQSQDRFKTNTVKL